VYSRREREISRYRVGGKLQRIVRTTVLTLLIFGALGLIAQPANAIYNGYAGSPTRFSWLATIKLNGKFLCGGSLIRSDVVLTAAHCVQSSGSTQ
jgi:secreted trypsin-like serine protease